MLRKSKSMISLNFKFVILFTFMCMMSLLFMISFDTGVLFSPVQKILNQGKKTFEPWHVISNNVAF